MLKATPEVFLKVFYSGDTIVSIPYCRDGIVYLYECKHSGITEYMTSPKTYSEYVKYVDNLSPLLKELR